MYSQQGTRQLKLLAILFVAALALFPRFEGAVAATQQRPERLFEFAGTDMPLQKRTGADDGMALVVHFGGDTRGNLDGCG